MIRRQLVVVMVCAGVLAAYTTPSAAAGAQGLILAERGASEFVIVVGGDASPSTQYAAEELQRFLKEMTGAQLPIAPDTGPVAAHEIILGDNAHLAQVGVDVDFARLGDEGYVIRTAGPHLVIAGGALRGTLYGVYGLLEDHLGCRWFTPEVSRIPKRDRLVIDAIDDTQVPVLEYREPFVMDCYDGDWCARNRMNSSAGSLEERHGGRVRFGAGLFVHTFNGLIPPEQYFDEHPEYFSEIKGKRIKDHTQLCCTNEDVIRICTEEMRTRIRQDPEAFVYSLSQNDWGNYCQCERCQALAEQEGSQMAPVLHLVNRVAGALAEEFPDKAIETLAYQWTRKPPKTMRPLPNVIIRLCSIECCFMHPLATCQSEDNRSFVRDLEGWAQVANRLWVWDYVTSFRHYLTPFPNLRLRNDNIQLYVANHVTGIFEQDVYNTVNGELSPLSGYLNAKFLWNPDYDEDTAMDEFLEGVYGDAARPIRKYIDLLHDKARNPKRHEGIWIGPRESSFLSDRVLAKADRLWDRAEAAVADSPDVLDRVRIARLSVEYAQIERQRGAGGLGQYRVDHKNFRVDPQTPYIERVSRFFEVAHAAGVTRMDEGRVSLDQYQAGFQLALDEKPRAFVPLDPVELPRTARGLRYACYEGTWQQLPDFDTLEPFAEGVAPTFGLDVCDRQQFFGMQFSGYINIRRDGLYTFYTSSNDGSRLYIGSTLIVDNDGLHGLQDKGGFVALRAGWHPITVDYFQEGGTTGLAVDYEGPGLKRRAIPRRALAYVETD
ncbi:MAG: DUF4838 domain-containing protein [Candidatus Hydrogenedentes bacterium]|nr:DUF4838 domain-containing protein [Candidatus Hydrogenedentota bacterium]